MNAKIRIRALRTWGNLVALWFCVGQPVLAEGTEGLNGHRWYWKEVQGHRLQYDGAYLEFGETNRLTGFSGCNRMMGAFEANETQMCFKGLASTRMFCEGMRGDEESLILKTLEAARGWRIEHNSLILFDAGGEPSGRLQAKP
jgi:heat shock protein HslJ